MGSAQVQGSSGAPPPATGQSWPSPCRLPSSRPRSTRSASQAGRACSTRAAAPASRSCSPPSEARPSRASMHRPGCWRWRESACRRPTCARESSRRCHTPTTPSTRSRRSTPCSMRATRPQRCARSGASRDPGVRVAITTWGRPEQCEMRAVLGAIGALLPPPPPGAGGPFALAAPGALEALVESAGLTAERAIEVPTPYAHDDLDTAVRAHLASGPARRAIETAGLEATRDAVTAACEQASSARRLRPSRQRLQGPGRARLNRSTRPGRAYRPGARRR